MFIISTTESLHALTFDIAWHCQPWWLPSANWTWGSNDTTAVSNISGHSSKCKVWRVMFVSCKYICIIILQLLVYWIHHSLYCMLVSLEDHLWDTAKAENKVHVEQFFAEVCFWWVSMDNYLYVDTFCFSFWVIIFVYVAFHLADSEKNPKW